MNDQMRQERLKNKVIKVFSNEYEKSLNNKSIYKPLSNAIYNTWKYFNQLEKPREIKNEK